LVENRPNRAEEIPFFRDIPANWGLEESNKGGEFDKSGNYAKSIGIRDLYSGKEQIIVGIEEK